MKKFVALCFGLLVSARLLAQQASEKVAEGTADNTDGYGEALSGDMLWKTVLLVVWSIIIIILVLRTFRGKAEI